MRAAPIICCIALAVLAGCDRSRLTQVEAERVAWWFEDVAHGVERDWRELVYADGSAGLGRVAAFARGGRSRDGTVRPPQPFARRARRWRLLVGRAIADGQLEFDRDGFLHLARGLDRDVALVLEPEIAQENLDRVFSAEVLLRACRLRLDDTRADELVALLVAAQRHHARAAGGKEWHDGSTSTSGTAATPSTSGPASSPRRGR